MSESNPNFDKHTDDPTLKKVVNAPDLTQCLVPGFDKCKLDDVLEFLGLEKEYGTDKLFVDGNKVPCTDTDNVPSYMAELNEKGFPHPDALLFDSLPESLFRGLKILGREMGNYDRQVELVNAWKTRLLADEALPILGTPDGIDFIIRLANDRQTRVDDWKAGGTGQAPTKFKDSPRRNKRANSVNLNDGQSITVVDGDGSGFTGTNTAILSPALLRKFLIDEEWEGVCGRISFYKEELEKVKVKLKDEGKKCEGCALNPYRAKFSKSLHEDFKASKIISDDEVASIKAKLKVDYLHVGTVEGKVYVR